MSFKFIITEKADEHDSFQRVEADPEDFIRNLLVQGHKVGEKDGSGIVAATLAAGGRWEGKHVETVTGIILDLDGKSRRNGVVVTEPIDPDPFLTLLPFLGVAHTSFNHTPDLPKFRVILPLKEAVSVADHFRLWHWINHLTQGKMDPSCKNPDRMYYLPRCSPVSAKQGWPWIKVLTGPLLDISMVPADFSTEEQFQWTRPVHRKQGLHKAAPETYRVNYDHERFFDAFMASSLVVWALEHPSDVSREVWRGIATNLAAVVNDDPETQERACELFHTISEPDPLRYNRSVTQKTFNDALKSAAQYGPMTYAKMIENGAPENIWLDKEVKAPVSASRKQARVGADYHPKTAAPVEAKVTAETPLNGSKAPPTPPKDDEEVPGFVNLDESKLADPPEEEGGGSDEVDYAHLAASYVFMSDVNRFRLRKADGTWGLANIVHDSLRQVLISEYHVEPKKVDAVKSLIPHCIEERAVFNSTSVVVKDKGDTVFNTFKPGELRPTNGDWSIYRELVMNLVNHDQASFDFVLDWLADPLQNLRHRDVHAPKQMGTALVFNGAPGTGKTTLARLMELFYGENNCKKLSQDDLDSHFSSMLKDKLFVICNEVISSTNRSQEVANKLKEWVTEPTIGYEEKGKNRITIPNHFNVMFTSNDDRPVLIERGDRRYSVFTSRTRLSQALSDKIYKDLFSANKSAACAFLYELMYRDTQLQFGRPFITPEREHMIAASLSSEHHFATEIKLDGWLAVSQPWLLAANPNTPREVVILNTQDVLASTLREVYVDWCRRNGKPSKDKVRLAQAVKEYFPAATTEQYRYAGAVVRTWRGLPMLMTATASPPPTPPSHLQLVPSPAEAPVESAKQGT